MKLELFYSSKHLPFDVPENEGFDLDEVLRLLEGLKDQAIYSVTDTSALSKGDLYEVYKLAMVPAVRKGRTGYNIRRVFGSRRISGHYFGREVPALLVYEEEGKNPTDVYPHQIGATVKTIREFLEDLS